MVDSKSDFPLCLSDAPSILEHVQSMPRLRNMQVEQVLGLKDRMDIRSRQALKNEFPDSCCIYIKCLCSITNSTSLIKSKPTTSGLASGTATPKPTQLGPPVCKSDQNVKDVGNNNSSRPSTLPLYSGMVHLCQITH
jgi:hypothetical protein